MPAIKLKKAAAEHQAEKEEREKEEKTKTPTKSLTAGLSDNIIFEKRKRTIPPSEKKLSEWMDENLQKKEGVKVSLPNLFDYYTEACHLDGCNVVDPSVFRARILDKFGKEFGFQETSAYKGLIKELKAVKKQSVKADSLRLKMKDIIEEAINKHGNPKKGLWFNTIKHYIAAHYPALRVDLRPGVLKAALQRGIRFGHIVQVKGIGKCGYYRLPADEEPDEEGETDAKTDDEDGKENGKNEEAEKKTVRTPDKRKKSEAEDDGKKEEGDTKDESTEAEESEEKPKKKRRKHVKQKVKDLQDIQHDDPKCVDDVFPLALTYMNEPKEASVVKIKKYIDKYYGDVSLDRLRSALEHGVEKGLFEKVSGKTGVLGSYRLIADEFNPKETKSLDDIICCAIIAGAEPKQSSAVLLKKYVSEYHDNFNIENRPHVFKHALERACRNGLITQLSGIGASGSFKLNYVFTPSPLILAGEHDEEEEEGEYDPQTVEKYVPRGTKSRTSHRQRETHQYADFTIFEPPKQKRKPPTDRSKAKPAEKQHKKKKTEKKKLR